MIVEHKAIINNLYWFPYAVSNEHMNYQTSKKKNNSKE